MDNFHCEERSEAGIGGDLRDARVVAATTET
jgi:hypothetical protein